jgi:hypothetical protein
MVPCLVVSSLVSSSDLSFVPFLRSYAVDQGVFPSKKKKNNFRWVSASLSVKRKPKSSCSDIETEMHRGEAM